MVENDEASEHADPDQKNERRPHGGNANPAKRPAKRCVLVNGHDTLLRLTKRPARPDHRRPRQQHARSSSASTGAMFHTTFVQGHSFGQEVLILRTGGAVETWRDTWPAWRDELRRMHSVSSARARGGPGSETFAHLRHLGEDVDDALPLGSVATPGASPPERGRRLFAGVTARLVAAAPELPVDSADGNALVRLWWWCWSSLGMSGAELALTTRNPDVVSGPIDGPWDGFKAATIESRMWRRQGRPPAGASADALEELTRVLSEVDTPLGTIDFEAVWVSCAVHRLRLLDPAALAFVAMLRSLSQQPIGINDVPGTHHSFRPVSLMDACATRTSLGELARRASDVGLCDFDGKTFKLAKGVRDALEADLLQPRELDNGAHSAVVTMHFQFPALNPRSRAALRRAETLSAHAYAAADASERRNVAEGWRDNLLERLCILEYEMGRFDAAADAGRRAVAAARGARRHGTELADKLVNYAVALARIDRTEEALDLYQLALDENEQHPIDRALTLNAYGALLRTLRLESEALRAQTEALGLIRNETPLDEESLAQVLHDTSMTEHAQGHFDQALALLEEAQALECTEETECMVQIRIVEAYNGLADFVQARRLGQQAMHRAADLFGSPSGEHVSAIAAHGRALEGIADDTGTDADRREAMAAWDRYVRLQEDLKRRGDPRSDV